MDGIALCKQHAHTDEYPALHYTKTTTNNIILYAFDISACTENQQRLATRLTVLCVIVLYMSSRTCPSDPSPACPVPAAAASQVRRLEVLNVRAPRGVPGAEVWQGLRHGGADGGHRHPGRQTGARRVWGDDPHRRHGGVHIFSPPHLQVSCYLRTWETGE